MLNNKNIFIIVSMLVGFLYARDTSYGESDIFISDTTHPGGIIIEPDGNETYEGNQEIEFVWRAHDIPLNEILTSIYIATTNGGIFELLLENISTDQGLNYITIPLPDISTSFAMFKIIVVDSFGNESEDYSNDYFIINEESGGGSGSGNSLVFSSESNLFISDTKNPSINLTSPNTGEEFEQSEEISITWQATDDNFGSNPISIYHSDNIGGFYNPLALNIDNSGLLIQEAPQINSAFNRLKIIVSDTFGNQSYDESSGYFIIGDPSSNSWGGNSEGNITSDETDIFISDTANPIIDLLSPNGGESFDSGENIFIDWLATDNSFGENPIDIHIATEIGGYFNLLIDNIPNSSFNIDLPEDDQAFVRLKLIASDLFGNSSTDYSDNYFILGDPFGNYNVNPYEELIILDWGWAGYHLIIIDEDVLSFMDNGDEIHVVDFNGIISDVCSDENYGMVSVANATYHNDINQPYSLYTIEGYDDCSESESIQSGYVRGNEVGFLHYNLSSDSFSALQPSFNSWSGYFGDTPQDTLTFKFYDQSENKTYTVNEKIPFTPDMTDGNAINPYEFTYDVEVYEEGQVDCDFNYHDYEHNGSITSTLTGIEIGDQFSSFVDDECRGTIEAMESPFETTVFYLLSYGNTALTVIDSFEQISMRSSISSPNYINQDNNLYSFNIYREGEIIEEGLSEYFYLDNDLLSDGEYCYEIALADIEGNEMIISDDQCLEIVSETENLLGDVDQNGNINVADIVLLVNWILNDISNEVGDVDQNGSINVADIVLLVYIILNQ